MRFFPQVSQGALAQFPLSRRTVLRTAVNSSGDGRELKLSDPDCAHVIWELSYSGLADSERAALAGLFAECEGRLGTFTFFDPWGNLLAWSEDLGQTVWTKSGEIYAAPDVKGTLLVDGGVSQVVCVPSQYVHTFSVYARADAPTEITLFRAAGTERAAETWAVDACWRRLQHTSALQTAADATTFGVEIANRARAMVFGLQLECQWGAGAYQKTLAQSGVYPEAAFDDDALDEIADAPGSHGLKVRVRARRQAG